MDFRRYLLAAAVMCSFVAHGSELEKDLSLHQSIRAELQQVSQETDIPGFSVAVVNQHGEIYSEGFGRINLDGKARYTANTPQKVASISKALLGVALLKAQELGMLSLEDPIDQYFPFEIRNPKHPEQEILLKHLALHTSSLRDTRNIFEHSYILQQKEIAANEKVLPFFKKSDETISLSKFLTNSLSTNGEWYGEESYFDFAAGEERRYSNLGAAICEYIIEKVSKQDYASFTNKHIFEPLNIKNAVWDSNEVGTESSLFFDNSTSLAKYKGFNKADGGLIISASELSLFLVELINGYMGTGTLLKAESYNEYFDLQSFPDQDRRYGIFIESRPKTFGFDDSVIGLMGADPGLLTAMFFNPETGMGKIMLLNIEPRQKSTRDGINKIWKAILDFEAKAAKIYIN